MRAVGMSLEDIFLKLTTEVDGTVAEAQALAHEQQVEATEENVAEAADENKGGEQ